ncbi:MAG: hypothetical protein K0U93_11740 [Gammaproteobacteria bacterium]|nr:hypothetical protein [Gammaproteobacteria bacterium]
MPIVRIESVLALEAVTPERAQLLSLADRLGRLFETPPGETSIRYTSVPLVHYAHNEAELADDSEPTFVEIIQYAAPLESVRRAQAHEIANLVAEALSRSKSSVHVIFQPDGRKRVAFGGELVD